MTATLPDLSAEVEARFWSKVDKENGPVHPTLGRCWPYAAFKNSKGYGLFAVRGKSPQIAHRVAYELATGDVPGMRVVRHRCDFPPCCRPDHLLIGTTADNAADMVARGRSLFGSRSWSAVLDEAKVIEIRHRRAQGESAVSLAAEYGVAVVTIYQAAGGQKWKYLPRTVAARHLASPSLTPSGATP